MVVLKAILFDELLKLSIIGGGFAENIFVFLEYPLLLAVLTNDNYTLGK